MNHQLNYLLRIADSNLILGQRMAEWCGHGPVLEEDIAMTNMALDLIGQARILYQFAGKIDPENRSDDDFAFLRDDVDFRNILLVEQNNNDFAYTMGRMFFFATFCKHFYKALTSSADEDLAAFAQKSLKESNYHFQHAQGWMMRLGLGTDESRERMQNAVDALWEYTGEMFEMDETDEAMIAAGIGANLSAIRIMWEGDVNKVLQAASLTVPEAETWMQSGGKNGHHSEHLGHLLAEMQFLQRAHPNAEW